jgi:hypothetical protein
MSPTLTDYGVQCNRVARSSRAYPSCSFHLNAMLYHMSEMMEDAALTLATVHCKIATTHRAGV